MSDDLLRAADARPDSVRTHWHGCYVDHDLCLIAALAARVRELEAERERLRQAINRIHECVLGEWDGSESEIADVINAALGEKP